MLPPAKEYFHEINWQTSCFHKINELISRCVLSTFKLLINKKVTLTYSSKSGEMKIRLTKNKFTPTVCQLELLKRLIGQTIDVTQPLRFDSSKTKALYFFLLMNKHSFLTCR